ncbi:hypothetical protein AJ88_34720 [Mesorhizobium amorphae CCBAU 01583]|nr:hypothetical protein AJ88_34720 [Mesorhizobium amorphae CCBAU 01583]
MTIARPAVERILSNAARHEAGDPAYDARNCLNLIRMVIEEKCPAGVLPSEEAVNGLYGPLPIHEAEARRVERCFADRLMNAPVSSSISVLLIPRDLASANSLCASSLTEITSARTIAGRLLLSHLYKKFVPRVLMANISSLSALSSVFTETQQRRSAA